MVAELIERGPNVWEIGSSVPGRVKSMTYKIDTCCFLAWRFAIIGYGKEWLAECQDNVTVVGGLISQWSSTIKSQQMHTATSWYLP